METMRFNHNKLRGKIREVCGTQDEFATRLGMARPTLGQKLNNNSEFTQGEIYRAMSILGESISDVGAYFFTPEETMNMGGTTS